MALWLVATTVATREQAQALARAIVEARLAACAQITGIESVYRWQGAVQQEGEFRILFKTDSGRYPALAEAIAVQHPYELPALYAVAAAEASPAFGEWVAQSCDPERDL